MVITRQLTDSASASTASDIQLGSCVTEIGQGAFSGYTNITDVEFPDGLTTIGVGAFSGSSITSVVFPRSLRTIENKAFMYCRNITSMDIPNGVTTIGSNAFYGLNITECTIGTGVTSIGTSVFSSNNMRKLTINATTPPTLGSGSLDGNYLIYVPYSSYNDYITASGWVNYKDRIVYTDFPYKAMFLNATGGSENFVPCNSSSVLTRNEVTSIVTTASTKVKFGNCLTTIGDGNASPFSGTSVNEIELSNSITTISSYAFAKMSGNLHILSFPSSITSFGNNIFSGTSVLIDSINLSENTTVGNGTFSNISATNVYFNISGDTRGIFSGSSITNFTFGSDVTKISYDMFASGNGLTTLTIPSNVTDVEERGFFRHESLKNIVFQGNVSRTIGDEAFIRTVISSVTIPNISSIGKYAFAYNTGLTKFNSSSNADAVVNCNIIPQNAFYGIYNGFETLEIGANVSQIQNSAFYGNTNLKKLHIIGNSSTVIEGVGSATAVFNNCSALIEVQIDNASSISRYTFTNSNAIEKITINGGYPSIVSNLFANKTSLSSLTLNGTTSIGDAAFSGCTSLASLELPSTLQSIGANAFRGCSGMNTLTIGNSIITIGDNAFSGCSGLNSILIGRATPPTIGTNVFAGSSCLIYVPQASYDLYVNAENWSVYRDRIFAVGSDYKAILIGGTTKVINCNGNTTLALSEVGSNIASTINIGNCVTAIGDNAFTGSSSAQTISISSGVTSIGTRAFYDRRKLTTVSGGEHVASIGDSAFQGCSALTSFDLSDDLTTVGAWAFCGTSLTNVVIPSGVTSIGNGAFQSKTIASATFESLTPPTIGDKSMTGYSSLFGKKIPVYVPCSAYDDYVAAWPWGGGSSTGQLIDYLVPYGQYEKDEEAVGEFICENGNKYKKMTHYVSSDNINWCERGYAAGELISEGDADCATFLHLEYDSSCSVCNGSGFSYTKYCYEATSTTATNADIPYELNYITAATFGDCVTEIGGQIFYSSSASGRLASVTIPTSVTSITDGAFRNCTNLTNITIPSSVTNIGNNAFQGSGLQSLVIPSSVRTIGASGFSYSKIENITILNGVTSIGERAFSPCTALTSVSLPDSVTTIGNSAFTNSSYVSVLTSVTIGSGITSIGARAFQDNSSLTSITIRATTPPTLVSTTAFLYTNDCPIYVPSGSVATYKASSDWSRYSSRIQAIP